MPEVLRHSGMWIRADRELLFHADETLARAVLAADAVVDGVPCAAGEEIEFHRGGRISAATLAEDALVRGLPASAGSPLAFHPDGSPRFLALARPRRIQGFPAAPGSLFLHPDGAVWNGLAAAAVEVDGVLLRAGTRVTVDARGGLRESWRLLAVDTEILGFPCSARFPVWSWRDGSPSCLHLARPSVVAGRRLPWLAEILLAPDGALLAARRPRYPASGRIPWRVLGADESPLVEDAA